MKINHQSKSGDHHFKGILTYLLSRKIINENQSSFQVNIYLLSIINENQSPIKIRRSPFQGNIYLHTIKENHQW
jgi:hypothetical protein